MSKQESQELKGVAILMMLFLHLFNHISNVQLCSIYLYINDEPLVYILTRMTNPVAFFVMLSGYGLYATWKKGDKHRWTRIITLVLHYWLILFIFVSIGMSVVPSKYPGTWGNIVQNLTAYNTTYNSEHWFLFPYILLALSSPFLFRICDKVNKFVVIGVSYIIYLVTCFLISRYGETYLFTHMLVYHPILYGSLLFNFLVGALACKNRWLKLYEHPKVNRWAWGILVLVCVVRCCFETGAFHNLYVYMFILIWLQASRPMWLKSFLMHLGKHSMNIWLIHSFFCYHIFHGWIYSFKYPVLIYGMLLLISYLSSCLINFVYAIGEKAFSSVLGMNGMQKK